MNIYSRRRFTGALRRMVVAGWRHRPPDATRGVQTTTPTGHRHACATPSMSPPRPARPPTRMEAYFADLPLAC